MKVVHFAIDEKFINSAYETFERAFPKENKFVILLDHRQSKIKHLDSSKEYFFIYRNEKWLDAFEGQIDRDTKLIVHHGLNFNASKIALLSKTHNLTQCWLVFGAEVYLNPYLFNKSIYGGYTYFRYVLLSRRSIRDYLWHLFSIFGKTNFYALSLKAMKKMDYLGILYEEEYKLYRSLSILKETSKPVSFTYYPIKTIINENDEVFGNNILLGNSAHYSNNHVEALKMLKESGVSKDQKIIVPLSYGLKGYAQSIIKIGKKMFGDQFQALTTFMPLQEYQQILRTCGITIMNHYRQQAIGNVMNTIYMGSKVYLSERNTLYHYLKRIGCDVYCLETEYKSKNGLSLHSLNKESVENNRSILNQELNQDKICGELKDKFQTVLN